MNLTTQPSFLTQTKIRHVAIIGAGLAGCDCAWFLAKKGIKVTLLEAKTLKQTPAQKSKFLAELVCTNSLKSQSTQSAHGLLKDEMKDLDSLILATALKHQVPAGEALAVNRDLFSQEITHKLKEHPLITIVEKIVTDPLALKDQLQTDAVVVATGPLGHSEFENWLEKNLSLPLVTQVVTQEKKEGKQQGLYFYDAIAPIVEGETLDYSKLYWKDRHQSSLLGKQGDYLNAPLTKEEYYHFVEELCQADVVLPHNFEDPKFFESCLPVDIMALRGKETLRFSCMKPIGLERPDGSLPFAVVQLRKENLLGNAFNLVGMQNRLKYKEQERIFRLIPGLEQANFLHLGSVHRNTFLNARLLLNSNFSSKKYPWLFFAGQITGVEGYTESASIGLYVGHCLAFPEHPTPWPVETAIGALVSFCLTNTRACPSNFNFGLMPPLEVEETKKRKKPLAVKRSLLVSRAREIFRKELSL